MSYPDVVQMAVPLFILALLAEIAAIRWFGARGGYETRDTVVSLAMGAGNVAIGLALGFIAYGFFTWLWSFRLFDLGHHWAIILLASSWMTCAITGSTGSRIAAAGSGRAM